MKKAVLFIALVATTAVGAQAQKFQGGEKNLEVEFNPFGGSPIGMPNGFRFRMFNSESSAIRVGFNIGGTNMSEVYEQQTQVDGSDGAKVVLPELNQNMKSFNFSIRPGYEMHFQGTDRLSPYVGAELAFSMSSSEMTREFHNSNNADDQSKPENWQTWDMTVKNGSSSFGLNALAGVDFYFVDNFYLGAEVSLGFQNTSYKDRETTASNEDAWKYSTGPESTGGRPDAQNDIDFYQATWNNEGTAIEYQTIIGTGDPNPFTNPAGTSPTKTSGWGPNFQSTIRLGWLF
jgi:opacity protein-like surface antigen